jgi:transcriptional regulator with XRE-family HTH domain
LDQFYLETDFSKGHLSEILRGKGSPSVDTLIKLAKSLDLEVSDFFVFPERSDRDRGRRTLAVGITPEDPTCTRGALEGLK